MKKYRLKEEALDKLSEVFTEDALKKFKGNRSIDDFIAMGVAKIELEEVLKGVQFPVNEEFWKNPKTNTWHHLVVANDYWYIDGVKYLKEKK